jgi:hypothetical protein
MGKRSVQPSFNCSLDDARLIALIAKRAVEVASRNGVVIDLMETNMDLTATHCNGCPLDLTRFLAAPDSDFGHDLFGIRRHLDRKTGKLGGCFLPRMAK